MFEYTLQEIINGLRVNNSDIINYIYSKYFKSIEKHVNINSGDSSDAWHLFHDALLVVYEKAKNDDLKISGTFYSYFFGICKYRWHKILRERKKGTTELYNDEINLNSENDLNYNKAENDCFLEATRFRIYKKNLNKLSPECKKMIKLVAKGKKMPEIRQSFNYKSDAFTYKKKSKCIKQLTKFINKDNELTELID